MNKRYPLIGLAGRARVGKDTAAGIIAALTRGYTYSFATPVRAMLAPLGIDLNLPYWEARKDEFIPALGVSPRRLMQTLGTEWGRDTINPDIWLVMAQRRLHASGPGMVVSDIRFENEAAWVRKFGGCVLHITRKDALAVEAHSSETPVPRFPEDITITNDGTIEELRYALEEVFGNGLS